MRIQVAFIVCAMFLLVSCQAFVEHSASVKERKISIAVESCMEAQKDRERTGTIGLAQLENIQEAVGYIIDDSDLEEAHKETLRLHFNRIGIDDCDAVEAQLRLEIPKAIKSIEGETVRAPIERIAEQKSADAGEERFWQNHSDVHVYSYTASRSSPSPMTRFVQR